MNLIESEVTGTFGTHKDTDLIYPGSDHNQVWFPYGPKHAYFLQQLDEAIEDSEGPINDDDMEYLERGINNLRVRDIIARSNGRKVSEFLNELRERNVRKGDLVKAIDILYQLRSFPQSYRMTKAFKVPYGWYRYTDISQVPTEELESWLALVRANKCW